MKNITNLLVVFLAVASVSLVGCGGNSAVPVSGKVTSNGKPVEGIRLVFSPVLVDANTDPGPWSSGLTNSAGEFVLETRYKDNGAWVGKHTVTFTYDDTCLLYTSPSPRDATLSRMPSSA